MKGGRRGWLTRFGSVRLLTRFGLLTLVPVVGLGIALSQLLSWTITQRAYDAAAQRGQLLAELAIQPLVTPDDVSKGCIQPLLPPDDPAEGCLQESNRLDYIDSRIKIVTGAPPDRVVVWNRDHRVVYSGDHALIGKSPKPVPGVDTALTGSTEVSVGSPGTAQANYLVISVPLRLQPGGDIDGAVEWLVPYGPIAAQVDADTHRLYVVMAAGLVILYAMMLPIVNPSYRARVRSMENEAQALREHYLADQAVRGSEAKSRFLANMSHELRTPLNSILGFAQLLRDQSFGPLNERQRRYVGHISSSGQHLLSLINDVLDLSKVQAGQMDLALEDVNVNAAIEDVLARARPLAEAKHLALSLAPGPEAVIRADPRRLEQVLWNLLSNAIKFTQFGQVAVSLSSTRSQARIAVTDTGVGIPYGEQSRVFEEFIQVSGGSAAQDGTGLGLALTRRLVELMGGRIAVESEPNAGSTFTVTMPLSSTQRRTVTPARTARRAG